MSAKSSSIVTALTAAALAVVGVLAYQASANAPDTPAQARPGASASPSPSDGSAGPKEKDKGKSEGQGKEATALPEQSGQGQRVVYSLARERVWLVGADAKVTRTYTVAPSNVSPPPGTYAVTSRSASVTGSDGVPIEHVVLFTSVDNVVIGFSSAVDGSMPEPSDTDAKKTGGIRAARDDGSAIWRFAPIGMKVVVIP